MEKKQVSQVTLIMKIMYINLLLYIALQTARFVYYKKETMSQSNVFSWKR